MNFRAIYQFQWGFFFSPSAARTKKKREKRTAARLFGSQSSDYGNSRLLMSGRREILHERLTCFVCSITKSTEGAKDSEVKQNTSGFVTQSFAAFLAQEGVAIATAQFFFSRPFFMAFLAVSRNIHEASTKKFQKMTNTGENDRLFVRNRRKHRKLELPMDRKIITERKEKEEKNTQF